MSESGSESLQGQVEVAPDAADCATSEIAGRVPWVDPSAGQPTSTRDPGRNVGCREDASTHGTRTPSQARIDANRANARHSTGPRTQAGKAKVARNAVKHGLLSRQAVLPTDDPAEFADFHAAMWIDLKAIGAREEMLAERIVAQYWRLRRAMRVEACLFDRDAGRSLALERTMHLDDVRPDGERVHPAALGEAFHQTLAAKHNPYEALRRYERTIQRDLDGCAKQLEELQGSRRDREDRAGPGRMPDFRETPAFADESPDAAPSDCPAGCRGLTIPIGNPRSASDCASTWVASRTGQPTAPGPATHGPATPGAATSTAPSDCPAAPAPRREADEPVDSDPVGFVSQAPQSDPVGFVSQPAGVERDITGRRHPSPGAVG